MIYKLTTVDTAISQVVRDLDIGDREIPWLDFVEWIAESLRHIGSYYQFTEKSILLDVEDYKAELPCDFHKLIRILNCGEYLNHNPYIVGEECQIQENRLTKQDINITHNTVTVSFRCGKLELLYLAMPLDKDGFPLVPDDPSYMDALFWRICYKLSLRGFEFKNPQLKNLDFTKRKWDFYCKQARGNANMPDTDMYERLKNNFLTLKTDQSQYIKRFSTLGKPEILTLNGRNRWPSY